MMLSMDASSGRVVTEKADDVSESEDDGGGLRAMSMIGVGRRARENGDDGGGGCCVRR